MKTIVKSKNSIIFIFLLMILISLALFVFSPLVQPTPHRDSGIFLYGGSELLHGKTLYKDAWDDKQPLIFFINAFGLWLGNGSFWGVWGLELVLYSATFTAFFIMLRKVLAPMISFIILLMVLFGIIRYFGGNYTEEFAVCFELLILVVLFQVYSSSISRKSRLLSSLIMGILVGLAYCLKQTYIDVALVVVLFLIFKGWVKNDKWIFLDLLFLILGFFFVNFIFLVYFIQHNALGDYWQAAYLFNGYYSNLPLLDRIQSVIAVFRVMVSQPIFLIILLIWFTIMGVLVIKIPKILIALARWKPTKWVLFFFGVAAIGAFSYARILSEDNGVGFLEYFALISGSLLVLIGVILLFLPSSNKVSITEVFNCWREKFAGLIWEEPNERVFLLLGFIDLPVVIAAISLSGRTYSHYYVTLLPVCIFLLSGFFLTLSRILKEKKRLNTAISLLLLTVIAGLGIYRAVSVLNPSNRVPAENNFAISGAYLKARTSVSDKILMWGYDAVIYYFADRESMTRYYFQNAAYFDWPMKTEVQQTIYYDLTNNPPVYIIDTNFLHPEYMPLIERRSKSECLELNPSNGTEMQRIINFICSNYDLEKKIGDFDIYKYQLSN